MTPLTLAWAEALVSELKAPNGEVLVSIALPTEVWAMHGEEGEFVVYSRPVSSLESARDSALAYAKAWLARHTSVEAVYGSMQAALDERRDEIDRLGSGALPGRKIARDHRSKEE